MGAFVLNLIISSLMLIFVNAGVARPVKGHRDTVRHRQLGTRKVVQSRVSTQIINMKPVPLGPTDLQGAQWAVTTGYTYAASNSTGHPMDRTEGTETIQFLFSEKLVISSPIPEKKLDWVPTGTYLWHCHDISEDDPQAMRWIKTINQAEVVGFNSEKLRVAIFYEASNCVHPHPEDTCSGSSTSEEGEQTLECREQSKAERATLKVAGNDWPKGGFFGARSIGILGPKIE